MNFAQHLRRQINFLQRSCQSYDNGNLDEAIRIATIVRVLIHQTNTSTSLLTHLNATTINLLTTTNDIEKGTLFKFSLGSMELGASGCNYSPQLGNATIQNLVPVNDWWNQIVFVLDQKTKLSRRKIILSAANQDGGAHVDASLAREYEALTKDGALGYFVTSSTEGEIKTPITDTHLVAIRQMAYELLNSPELIKLA